jgi:hypothetical protein
VILFSAFYQTRTHALPLRLLLLLLLLLLSAAAAAATSLKVGTHPT